NRLLFGALLIYQLSLELSSFFAKFFLNYTPPLVQQSHKRDINNNNQRNVVLTAHKKLKLALFGTLGACN
ncbi:hypothetical protein, partial [Microcoleus sp. B4-D4]|uniref:hypothetical protein n=1 Tax=Microcoleus sp. B4-D4 TaxID=2818667 RepID=UPI002FCF11A2